MSSCGPKGMWINPKEIANISERVYRNNGLTPNDSKNGHQDLCPFKSIIHINRANKDEAVPHVISEKEGLQIFLLTGHPNERRAPDNVSIRPMTKRNSIFLS